MAQSRRQWKVGGVVMLENKVEPDRRWRQKLKLFLSQLTYPALSTVVTGENAVALHGGGHGIVTEGTHHIRRVSLQVCLPTVPIRSVSASQFTPAKV